MKCPACNEIDLVMADRLGVEIDYCPKCRGVWLDRGELDKIVERSTTEMPGRVGYDRGHGDDHDHDHDHDHKGGFFGGHSDHRGRRKSWLGELFD
jgi:Zn-finger nucleic acid-binding protein